MYIPVNEFEQHINVAILKRGLQYFKKGQVLRVDECSPGEYEAVVEGTDRYVVRLHAGNGIITRIECECPYIDVHSLYGCIPEITIRTPEFIFDSIRMRGSSFSFFRVSHNSELRASPFDL